LLLVSGLIVGVAAVALLLRWFLKPLPVGLAPAKKALPTRSRVDATVEVQSPDEGSSSGSNGTQPEDLTLISGIGPKTANLLVSEGITTFQLLAEKSEEDLTELLRKSGFRIVNPATWPKQASLAAAGDWDGLKNYLEDLKQKPA
jgi:predicted flap endonuclease-1-like 5' DNA nuclease